MIVDFALDVDYFWIDQAVFSHKAIVENIGTYRAQTWVIKAKDSSNIQSVDMVCSRKCYRVDKTREGHEYKDME